MKIKIKREIQQLLEAKDALGAANVKIFSFNSFFLKSSMLNDGQLVNSKIREIMMGQEGTFRNIWDIKIEPYKYVKDLTEDKIYGSHAKKLLKEEDHIARVIYNKYSLH
mmetsp:Transcript_12535/g.11082  ORF Transcript_12535/g.11082 Transcript_12535/m.11082 type:complete len:109 (-) Transcript_12535:18-344(-)